MKSFLVALLLALACATGTAASLNQHAAKLASLIDPAKLATLAKRGANPRIQKAVAILEDARREACPVATVASNAVFLAGYTNAVLAQLRRDALTRNQGIAAKLDCLDVFDRLCEN